MYLNESILAPKSGKETANRVAQAKRGFPEQIDRRQHYRRQLSDVYDNALREETSDPVYFAQILACHLHERTCLAPRLKHFEQYLE